MTRRNIAYNQIGQKFTVHPTNNDDANAVTPLDLTNYAQAHILIRQPDGNVTAYPATVTGAPEINKLTGVRVDSEPPMMTQISMMVMTGLSFQEVLKTLVLTH